MPASDGLGNRIIYNGQVLYNVNTESIEQRILMDPTNIDFVANEVSITVTGTLHPYSPTALGHGYNAGAELHNVDGVMELFGQNRKPFQYYIGDNPVWSVWPIEAYSSRSPDTTYWLADIADGPKVESTVMNVASDQAAGLVSDLHLTDPPDTEALRAEVSRVLHPVVASESA